MPHLNDHLRQELLDMVAEDSYVREELAADGSLYEGYHPKMEAVHNRNAARLIAIIEQHGWPVQNLVGEDGAEAAWLVVQHAISHPDLQRRALALLKEAVIAGEAHPRQAAMLEDRIRSFEGRLQIYGTQFDWDENGEMSPCPEIEDPDNVDERRQALGLRPLAEEIKRHRKAVAESNEKPPEDRVKREEEFLKWAREVGWRS